LLASLIGFEGMCACWNAALLVPCREGMLTTFSADPDTQPPTKIQL